MRGRSPVPVFIEPEVMEPEVMKPEVIKPEVMKPEVPPTLFKFPTNRCSPLRRAQPIGGGRK